MWRYVLIKIKENLVPTVSGRIVDLIFARINKRTFTIFG